MKVGVVTFPGSLDDRDALRAIRFMGAYPMRLWHEDSDLKGADVVVIPGGFSYGDYLRTGAVASVSPIIESIRDHAEKGGGVVGICNGFQILCEAGLLPGGLARNSHGLYVGRYVHVRVEANTSVLTSAIEPGTVLEMPIKHGEGRYVAYPAESLNQLESQGRVVFRYSSSDGSVDSTTNPNGSVNNIAGIANEAGNVVGLMPHPEHAVDPDLGPTGGRPLFESLLASFVPAAT